VFAAGGLPLEQAVERDDGRPKVIHDNGRRGLHLVDLDVVNVHVNVYIRAPIVGVSLLPVQKLIHEGKIL
jgi:hypothetical protein